MFELKIETLTDAFDGNPNPELARILRKLADKLGGAPDRQVDGEAVMDVNGNTVGRWSVCDLAPVVPAREDPTLFYTPGTS